MLKRNALVSLGIQVKVVVLIDRLLYLQFSKWTCWSSLMLVDQVQTCIALSQHTQYFYDFVFISMTSELWIKRLLSFVPVGKSNKTHGWKFRCSCRFINTIVTAQVVQHLPFTSIYFPGFNPIHISHSTLSIFLSSIYSHSHLPPIYSQMHF